jgi:hypothetical protein
MTASERAARIPDDSLVAFVREAYERGQTVEALRRAEAFAPLKGWQGISSSVIAARIAANTGAPLGRQAEFARLEDQPESSGSAGAIWL